MKFLPPLTKFLPLTFNLGENCAKIYFAGDTGHSQQVNGDGCKEPTSLVYVLWSHTITGGWAGVWFGVRVFGWVYGWVGGGRWVSR